MPRRTRVLHAYRMEQGGAIGYQEVHLGGEHFRCRAELRFLMVPVVIRQSVSGGVLGKLFQTRV